MYSKHAKWLKILDIEAPIDLLTEIATLYKEQWYFPSYKMTQDFYYAPRIGLCVVIDGPKVELDEYHGYRKDVQDWRWEEMEKLDV